MDSVRVAPFFSSVLDFTNIRVLPPYENKDKPSPQWVRGYIRNSGRDFIVTGPKLRVCFGGCRWNKMVLAMPGPADEVAYSFERWLQALCPVIENQIWQNPERFKPGAKSSTRFLFDHEFIKPSIDPTVYASELRCRLSVNREDKVDTDLFRVEDGSKVPMDPSEITAGSYIIPIFRISYYRNVERFGLVLTIVKGEVFPAEHRSLDNKELEFDYPL